MTKQREILQLIADRSRDGKDTSFQTLVDEFLLSPESACGHLKRTWREGLICSSEVPPRRRPSLSPGESIRDLRFELARRGRRRLKWYADKDAERDEEWFG
jgi:hypothetical protein